MKNKDKSIIETIIAGFIALLPLLLLMIGVYVIIAFIFGLLAPLQIIYSDRYPGFVLNGISLFLVLMLFYILGLLISIGSFSRKFQVVENSLLYKIPFYKSLKDTIMRFTGDKDLPFRYVVLVDIYGSGTTMTGFVTQNVKGKIFTVFVPTAPNPMNGNIYHVPRELVTFVDVPADIAMKAIIGLGVGSDELFKSTIPAPYDEEEDSSIDEVIE